LTLPSEREIVMTRVFDAPRELVFEAHSKCEHMSRWWGPRRHTTTVDKMDVRPGGVWRYVSRDADGNEYGFHGEYREVVRPERLVATFEFEPMPGHVSVETLTLVEYEGKTTLTNTMLESGMEAGMRETYDRLAEYIERLK